MQIIKTTIKDLCLLQPIIYTDGRGYFFESFKNSEFNLHFPSINFIQENESKSSKGVLRGLHFQKEPFDQTKLIRVVSGEILDVVVDIRTQSKTFGEHRSFILSSDNKLQLLVPRGFAHGFLVLSEEAIVSYKVDNTYNKESESGIIFNDPKLNINWGVNESDLKLSHKDLQLGLFEETFDLSKYPKGVQE